MALEAITQPNPPTEREKRLREVAQLNLSSADAQLYKFYVIDFVNGSIASVEQLRGLIQLARESHADTRTPQPKPDRERAEALAVLGLADPVTRVDVERAFKRAALRAHPDLQGGSTAAMQEVNNARAVLLRAITT